MKYVLYEFRFSHAIKFTMLKYKVHICKEICTNWWICHSIDSCTNICSGKRKEKPPSGILKEWMNVYFSQTISMVHEVQKKNIYKCTNAKGHS